MNDVQRDRRGVKRIGGVFLALSLSFFLAISLGWGIDGPDKLLITLLLVLIGATGAGLIKGSTIASVAAQVLLLVCVAAAPLRLVGALVGIDGSATLDTRRVFEMLNAIFTTALWMWICFRGLLILRGKNLLAAVFTSRLTGVALAAIATNHLYEAALMGSNGRVLASTKSLAFHVNTQGTALYGFAAWPFWHAAVLLTAAVLLRAPRPGLIRALGALAGLFAVTLPLSLVRLAGLRVRELVTVAPLLALLLLPMLLAWWLREELIGPVPAKLPASTTGSPPPKAP